MRCGRRRPRSRCDRRHRQRRGDHDRGRACGRRSGRGRRDRLAGAPGPVDARGCRRATRASPLRRIGRTSGDDGDTHGGLASAPPVRRRAGRPPRTRRGHGGRGGDARLRGDRGYRLLRLVVRCRGRRGGPAPPDVGAAGRTVSGPGDRPTGPAAPTPGRETGEVAPPAPPSGTDGYRNRPLPAPSLRSRAGSHVDRALTLRCRGDDRRRHGPGAGSTLDPRIGLRAGRGPAERRSRGRGVRCRPEPGRRHRSRPRGTAERGRRAGPPGSPPAGGGPVVSSPRPRTETTGSR